MRESPPSTDPVERREQLVEIRRRVAMIRGDARYWRRRGRPGTAAELERVAAFLDETAARMASVVDLLAR